MTGSDHLECSIKKYDPLTLSAVNISKDVFRTTGEYNPKGHL